MSETPNLPATVVKKVDKYLDSLPAYSIEELQAKTLERLLTAPDLDTLLANPEAVGLEDYTGQVLIVHGVSGVLPSTYTSGFSRYIVLDCESETTGERFSVTAGGAYVVAAIVRASETAAFPLRVRVLALESKSNPGQVSMWLVKP